MSRKLTQLQSRIEKVAHPKKDLRLQFEALVLSWHFGGEVGLEGEFRTKEHGHLLILDLASWRVPAQVIPSAEVH